MSTVNLISRLFAKDVDMNPSMGEPVHANHKMNKGPRACSTCAKAKARCVPGPDARKCERCHRLNKICPSQIPAPPRRRKEPKPTRVAELERRLEDLTSRIAKAQAPSPPESQEDLTPRTTDETGRFGAACSVEYLTPAGTEPRGRCYLMGHIFPSEADEFIGRSEPAPLTESEATPRPLPAPVPVMDETNGLWPTGRDADMLLAEYKSQLEQLFPFVIVPPGMTSNQLRHQRPFLWKAVMMEACHLDGPHQIALGEALLKEITEAAIIRPQKSLDLLQGLQMLISWFHYNLNSFQMTNLLYLARSICVSLGLNDSPSTKQAEPTSENLEQMRAFAGTYYLVTVILTTNKKPDALTSTSQLNTCLATLLSRMEYPTDDLLVHLVRAQQLSQSICLSLSPKTSTTTLPLSILTTSLQTQLTHLKSSLPPHLTTNPSLQGHHHVAAIQLHELALTEPCPLPPTDRLGSLWACLTATKSFFAVRSATPLGGQPWFTCMATFDLIYAFLTAIRLITLLLPGWDLALVKEELSFDDVVDRQIQDLQLLADRRLTRKSRDGRGGEDPFRKLADKLKMLKDALCGDIEIMMNDSLQKAATTGAMTVTDATQGIVEDLEGSLWENLVVAASAGGWGLEGGTWQGFGYL